MLFVLIPEVAEVVLPALQGTAIAKLLACAF